jgi:hypothetical protein
MEVVVADSGGTSVIDWILVSSAEDGNFGSRSEIGFNIHPNPSKPGAFAAFTLAKAGVVEISIYNVAGRRVRQLLTGMQAGSRKSVLLR